MRLRPGYDILARPADRIHRADRGGRHWFRVSSTPSLIIASVLLISAFAATSTAAAPATSPRPASSAWIGPIDVSDELAEAKQRSFARLFASEQIATANQMSFDFHFYDLDLHPNPANSVLTASVHAMASVVAGPVSAMELDLNSSSMTIDGVTCAGLPATFTFSANLLHVNLDRPYLTGEQVNVTVAYHGTPQTGAFGGAFTFFTHNGQPLISTLSEPFDARQWWPCKDDPADKADSVDVRVTLPTGMITASNGTLVTSTDDGTTAFRHWKCRHPIATYLVSIASHPYAFSSDWYVPAVGPPMEIQFYIFPDQAANYAPVDAKVKNMIAAFATRYGEYPFLDEKYGEAEFTWGGGMENQTCTSLGTSSESVVAHELSHEWFGDAITCRDFHHIWLNEGFATYSEALWAEAQGGASAYATSMSAKRYMGSGSIYCPDLSSVSRIFSSNLSYRKPSWVLHMLRHILGDAAFFSALQTYQQQFAYSTAVTEDFQGVCESVSGVPLGRFFHEWIYGEYYPQYQVIWSSAPAGGGYDVTLQLQQTQSWQLFQMPVDVRIQTNTAAFYNFVIQDSLASQSFTLHVPESPVALVVDPDNWILQTTSYPTAVTLPPRAPEALSLASPSPNPAWGPTQLSFVTPRGGHVTLTLLDAAGRRLVSLIDAVLPAGAHEATWNGRDQAGAAARSGIYWAVLDLAGQRVTRKLVVAH